MEWSPTTLTCRRFAELGLIGGTLFIGSLLVPFQMLIRQSRAAGPTSPQDWTRWIGCTLVVLSAYCIGMFSLTRIYTLTTYVLLGLATVATRLAAAEFPGTAAVWGRPLLQRIGIASVATLALFGNLRPGDDLNRQTMTLIAPDSAALNPTTSPAAAGSLSVVHVVLSLDVGGLERIVVDLVRDGIAQGNQLWVVCLSSGGALATAVTSAGATLVVIGKKPGVRPGIVPRLVKLFSTLRPDVVHTHQIGALFYAGSAARLARTPAVIHTEHGKHFTTRRRTRLLGRIAGWFAHRFVCVSTDIANDVSFPRNRPPIEAGRDLQRN